MSDSKKFLVVCLCLIMVVNVSFAQRITQVKNADSPYIQGAKPMFAVIPRVPEPGSVPPPVQIPIWTGSFTFNSQTFHYNMVGTDPSLGSATSKIPLVIVPLKFQFSNGQSLSAKQTVCGDTTNHGHAHQEIAGDFQRRHLHCRAARTSARRNTLTPSNAPTSGIL